MQFSVKQLIASLQQLPNQEARLDFWTGDKHVVDVCSIESKEYSTLDETKPADFPLPQRVTINLGSN